MRVKENYYGTKWISWKPYPTLIGRLRYWLNIYKLKGYGEENKSL